MSKGRDMWIIFNQNSALAEFFVFSTIFLSEGTSHQIYMSKH